jgi:hypothetical protein
MTKKLRLLLAAVAIMLVGASFTATAAQASRGIRSSLTRIGVSGQLVLNSAVTCNVLLELTLRNAGGVINKVTTPAQGDVTFGSITGCSGLGATTGVVLTPIPVYYSSFGGTLPNISSISVNAGDSTRPVGFLLNTAVGSCLYGGTATNVLRGVRITRNTVTGAATGVTFTGSSSLNRFSGSFLCPSTATIAGSLTTFLITPPPTLTLV